ncbi:hypothetical protein L7F22_056109 [Adiantum nelumboides]|nr:hypothetical protein [Adiantum nelumboides]
MGSSPRLSYAQLFSFQVSYTNHADSRGYANQGGFGLIGLATSLAKKKGEWKRAILEFDFVMETMFLQDKDRIVVSAIFKTYRRTVSGSSDDDDNDTLLSLRFEEEQWEIMAQNGEEKKAIMHLLDASSYSFSFSCVSKNMFAEEASEVGKKNGVIGVSSELVGKHVRYVTSLIGARVQISRSRMEFEILVPNTKDLVFSSASSMEGFSSWVKVIEASANGETRVYSDDSDGYDEGENHGGRTHRSQRGGEHSRARPRGQFNDEMPDDPIGAASRDAQISRYAGDDHRYQPQEGDRNWDRRKGLYQGGPRFRPDAALYGWLADTHENNMDELSRRLPLVDSPAYPYGAASTLKGEDNLGQRQLRNVNMRRRSVPLQCLDSALDEMTASIGKMAPFQEGKVQGTMPSSSSSNTGETANNYNMQSSRPIMAEVPNDSCFQASVRFNNRLPLPDTAPLETLVEDQNEYIGQTSLEGDSTKMQSQGNDLSSFYEFQNNYTQGSKQVPSQGIDNQRSYPTSPTQMQSLGNESPSSYDNQSSYMSIPKQAQMQGGDSNTPYQNQDHYLTGYKQIQLQGNDPSMFGNQCTYLTGPNKQTRPQGTSPQAYLNQSNNMMGPKQRQVQGNEASTASAYINQSSSSNTSRQTQTQGINASSPNTKNNHGHPMDSSHDTSGVKAPMTRSDTKAYGAIMGGPTYAAQQPSTITRMPNPRP